MVFHEVEAGRLVELGNNLGYPIGPGEADRLLKRLKSFFRAAAWIRARIRAERQRVQEQIIAGEIRASGKMTGTKRIKSEETTTNDDIPYDGVLKGSKLAIGEKPTYTSSYSRFGRKGFGGFNYPDKVLYRFQSLVPLNSLDAANSLLPGPATSDWEYQLPMYCFNLSVPGDTGISGTVPKKGKYINHPFYRLKKVFRRPADGKALDPSVMNYYWEAAIGINNNPASIPLGTTNDRYGWYREVADQLPHNASYFKNLYNEIKLLFRARDGCENVCHVALVQMDQEVCPHRAYQLNDNDGVLDTKDAFYMPAFDVIKTGQADTFWESFWSHRVVHPMSHYNQEDKKGFIKFLKHETIKIYPTAAYEGVIQYEHLKNMFVGSVGRGTTMIANKSDDSDLTTNGNITNPPVNVMNYTDNFGAFCGAYNQITKVSEIGPYPPDRERDVYLLIWCDHKGGVGQVGDMGCSFDLQVRSAFGYSHV